MAAKYTAEEQRISDLLNPIMDRVHGRFGYHALRADTVIAKAVDSRMLEFRQLVHNISRPASGSKPTI